MTIRFDDSLPAFLKLLEAEFGADVFTRAIIIRDATGYLSAVVDQIIGDDRLAELNAKATEVLGGYARTEDCIRDREGPGAQRLLEMPTGFRVAVENTNINFVDRRIVGADWLLPPKEPNAIQRVAFVSIKGGVGRSTALAVLAAYLSSRGRRVLTIDMDLEAPGIGTMLLSADTMPKYGVLDYLVENGISGINEEFLENSIGRSPLGAGGGVVAVLPAFGTETLKHPADGLAKIARAYLEDIKPGGGTISLTDQVREMLDRLESTGAYDVVLIDARAGLHETTASVVLGLGAEALLFGIDEPQTFIGYRLLLAHLALRQGSEYEGWKQRMQFVNAKASPDPHAQLEASAKFSELMTVFNTSEYEVEGGDVLSEDDFDTTWKIETGDVVAEIVGDETPLIRILDDTRYRAFNPIQEPSLLTSELFATTFSDLLTWADEVLIGRDE